MWRSHPSNCRPTESKEQQHQQQQQKQQFFFAGAIQLCYKTKRKQKVKRNKQYIFIVHYLDNMFQVTDHHTTPLQKAA
jgi:hypothetical protein